MSNANEKDVPVIGILIPCHNHGRYLKRAVDSVLIQDTPVVICIVDDASTDGSYQMAKDLLTSTRSEAMDDEGDVVTFGKINDTAMVIVSKTECQKQAAARNKAIKLLWKSCDYFCQLDADDQYRENKLKKSLAVIQSNPIIGLVYSDFYIRNEDTHVTIHDIKPAYSRAILEKENVITNAPLIRKEAFEKVGLYDEDLPPCEDWDMWLRITEHFLAIHIPEPLHEYAVTKQSCTFTVSEDIWDKQWKKIQNKLLERKSKMT